MLCGYLGAKIHETALPRDLLHDHEGERHGAIQVTAGDVTNSKRDDEHGEPKAQSDTQIDRALRES